MIKGRLAMNFVYDRPRAGLSAKTTFEAIKTGERTSTTRWGAHGEQLKKYREGDIIEVRNQYGKKIKVEVTKRAVELDRQKMLTEERWREYWSQLEGWAPEAALDFFNRDDPAYLIRYKYLEG